MGIASQNSAQCDLFAVPQPAAAQPGAMDYRVGLSHLVSEVLSAASAAGRDRHEIAGRMSALAGYTVSVNMLNGYTSESREAFNVPLHLIPALEHACETHAITNWLVAVRGGQLLIGRDALHAELGRLQRVSDQAQRNIKRLKKQMGEGDE